MRRAANEIAAEEWRAQQGRKQARSKYGAKKMTIDGITFASKKEAQRYQELKLMEGNGDIKNLELQPRFELQPKFKHGGKTIRAIHYVADFQYNDSDGRLVIEDTKGDQTAVFKLKHKMFLFCYPDLELRIL